MDFGLLRNMGIITKIFNKLRISLMMIFVIIQWMMNVRRS